MFGLLAVWLALHTAPASADRRYFVETYTPYLAPAGELELESWVTAKSGKQDPSQHTSWELREEFEYAITDRLTGAAYVNYSRPSGGALHFDSPSLEFIYKLAEPGRLPGDPAIYLETTESGEELELEPKLLLAHRVRRLVTALNLIGEFEFRHNDKGLLPDGSVMRKAFKGEISAGLAYEFGPKVAIGLETRYREEHPNFGARAGSIFSLGPSINLRTTKVQLAVGVLPQLWGSPKSSGHRNLVDFERTQIRAVLGIDL